MSNMQIAGAQFTSASTAGSVYVELGFIPDCVMVFSAVTGTVGFWYWFRGGTGKTFPLYPAAQSIKDTGAAFSLDTTASMDEYAGGETIAVAENVNTAGKHVNRQGVAAAAGHVTAPGVLIPADHQTNSGVVVLLAFRVNAQP